MSEGIEHYVTESDGTPATGKNSVLRLFLESDNEYMVHVDGDDMITPYGRNLYRTAAHTDAPDVICLQNELEIQNYRPELLSLFRDQIDSNTVERNLLFIPRSYMPRHPYVLIKGSVGDRATIQRYRSDLNDSIIESWLSDRKYLVDFYSKYSDGRNSLNRIVFLSRKAAEMMWYDPVLTIGEDLVQLYKLKKLAYNGAIDMRVRNENPRYTYLHLTETSSITRGEAFDWSWQSSLIEELNKLDMYPEGFHLPEFVDPHYEVKQK